MTAVIEAKALIEDREFEQVSDVYANNLPQEIQENIDKTLILVTDVRTDLDSFGDNTFFAMNRQVEIQVFYKLDLDFDPEKLEAELLKLFMCDEWSVVDIRSHSLDPDTNQLTFTFYATQLKLMEEI